MGLTEDTVKEAMALAGGLPDMTIATKEERPADVPAATPASQKYVIGDKTFNSTEEALAYANGLAVTRNKEAANASAVNPPIVLPPPVKLGTLLFEDPDAAINQLKAQVHQEFDAKQRKVDQDRKFWDDFYTSNPDLRGSERMVDSVLLEGQRSGMYANISLAEAVPILAAKSRQEVQKIRNVPTGGTPLSSQPAVVAGASGQPGPAQAPAKPAPSNFITELAQMRKKG